MVWNNCDRFEKVLSLRLMTYFVAELDDETRRLHEEQVVKNRMVTTFTDAVLYVLYLCLLIGISDEVGGERSFLQTQNVKNFLPVYLLIGP